MKKVFEKKVFEDRSDRITKCLDSDSVGPIGATLRAAPSPTTFNDLHANSTLEHEATLADVKCYYDSTY